MKLGSERVQNELGPIDTGQHGPWQELTCAYLMKVLHCERSRDVAISYDARGREGASRDDGRSLKK